ncbi:MAG: hypothetical protein WCS94_18390 [Verrucomicrobiota bacterium]
MSFQTAAYLRKATGRAKSDVANKLVSMFLHEVSRKITAKIGLNVSDPKYVQAVESEFGGRCCYCDRSLESDRAAVEHPDGMNRFRAGLHIPGNVIVSCKRCNNEKRRDDQLPKLTLAETGWESFLSHDGIKCDAHCKTCLYWKTIWPGESRVEALEAARQKLLYFRRRYDAPLELNRRAHNSLRRELDKIYRDCQMFATDRIKKAVDLAIED